MKELHHRGFRSEILGWVTVGFRLKNLCKPLRPEPQTENTEAVLDISLEEEQEEGIVGN